MIIFLVLAGFNGSSASENGSFFIRGKNIDNLRDSIIDLIIAEKRNPASRYLKGSSRKLPIDTESRVRAF